MRGVVGARYFCPASKPRLFLRAARGRAVVSKSCGARLSSRGGGGASGAVVCREASSQRLGRIAAAPGARRASAQETRGGARPRGSSGCPAVGGERSCACAAGSLPLLPWAAPHPPAACEWRPRLRLRRPRPPRRPRRPLAAPARARARRAVRSALPPLQPPRPLHPRRPPRGAVARRRSFWSIAACVANVCGLSGSLDCCPACIRPVVPAWVPPHRPQRIIRGMAAQRATALVSAGWPGAPPPPRSLCSGLRLCESLGGPGRVRPGDLLGNGFLASVRCVWLGLDMR